MATFFSVLAQILFWAVMVDLAIGVIFALIDMFTQKNVTYILGIVMGFYFVATMILLIIVVINGFCFRSFPW